MTRQDSKAAFVKKMSSITDGQGLSGKTRALIIAHAALESGWGLSPQAARVFNYWNIAAGSSWKGSVMQGGDLEFTKVKDPVTGVVNTVSKKITQNWRAYKTEAEAFHDYFNRVLTYGRYLPARAALMDGDPESFVRLLGPDRANERPPVGGYYTLPTNDYLRLYNEKLAEVMQYVDAGFYTPPMSNPPPVCL